MSRHKGLTDELILEALVRCGGIARRAAADLGCTVPGLCVRYRNMGIPLSKNASQRRAAVVKAAALLQERRRVATMASRRDVPETPRVSARCHRDKEEFAIGLCRDCYHDRVARSRATPIRRYTPEELAEREEIRRQLEGIEIPTGKLGTPITDAELNVLSVAARGATMRETAAQIGISEQTVKNHMSSIYRRLDVRNLQEALCKMGWVSQGPADLEVARETLERAEQALVTVAKMVLAAMNAIDAAREMADDVEDAA